MAIKFVKQRFDCVLHVARDHTMQRIFRLAVAPANSAGGKKASGATGELKIGWTKPRANDGGMGIECALRGAEYPASGSAEGP